MDTLLGLIDAGYLNAILKRSGVLGDGHVREVTVVSDRRTLMSRIIRLRLDYDGLADGLARGLIVKTGLPEHRGTEWGNGRLEETFYRDVAPSLPAGLVPKCFDARSADTDTPGHLVLEDLTETHVLASEWPLPPSAAQCRTILGSLAQLHAAWWDDPRLGVTVGTRLDDAGLERFFGQVAGHYAVFADRIGDELSADRRVFYEGMMAAGPVLHQRHREGRNITITHGDAHVWNCFLPRDGRDDVRWFDWDGWRIRRPTNDLAYMMAVHWYPERRRRLEGTLLDHYHSVLLQNGVSGYSLAEMREDYRLSVLWHAFTPVFQAGLKLPPVIWWNNYQRIMAAVDDLDCRALLG